MSEPTQQVGEEGVREPWTDVEVRIVGALVEKQITTPDNYPLSLNALKNACNQKSSRDPVMQLDEKTIDDATYGLRMRNLMSVIHLAGSHVPKYKHNLPGYFGLEDKEVAVLCVLMLRGPQTPGEIRTRTGRMFAFESVAEVVSTLDEIMRRIEPPIVARLPREPGHKEQRYTHLLCGPESAAQQQAAAEADTAEAEPSPSQDDPSGNELEEEVASLRKELEDLRAQFEEFCRQFN